MHILLASSSPRREALLRQLDIACRVEVPRVDEEAILAAAMPADQFPSLETVRAAACRLAEAKAVEVLASLQAASAAAQPGHEAEPAIVLAADTMVVCDAVILNKPADAADARRMLEMLSGKTHHVVSGLCVRTFDQRNPGASEGQTEAAVTEVRFRALSAALIEGYVATGEPLDKAGGYGIQGLGAALVERIDGCYFNVVGLPIALLCRMLDELGRPLEGFWQR